MSTRRTKLNQIRYEMTRWLPVAFSITCILAGAVCVIIAPSLPLRVISLAFVMIFSYLGGTTYTRVNTSTLVYSVDQHVRQVIRHVITTSDNGDQTELSLARAITDELVMEGLLTMDQQTQARNMVLMRLVVNDGTVHERELVDSLAPHICR